MGSAVQAQGFGSENDHRGKGPHDPIMEALVLKSWLGHSSEAEEHWLDRGQSIMSAGQRKPTWEPRGQTEDGAGDGVAQAH